ncbi:MAG: hypothetical protein ISR65_18020 [Bacteriovoracaceae bacterium]|nr:hypothetical protein [Bacteriovoracaceae bacterium]
MKNQVLPYLSIVSIIILVILLILLQAVPQLGLNFIWNLIIPFAPLIFLLIPNTWVVLCPLAIVQTLPKRLHINKGVSLSNKQSEGLQWFGWLLLYILIPLRPTLFNKNADLMFITIIALAIIAFLTGVFLKGLSGFCMGICPIRPVEMLYAQFSVEKSLPEPCEPCSSQCLDQCARKLLDQPQKIQLSNYHFKFFVFSFPGFVLGYFLSSGAMPVWWIYVVIYFFAFFSFVIFYLLERILVARKTLTMNLSIIVAITTYYSFTVPGMSEAWSEAYVFPSTSNYWFYIIPFSILLLNLVRFALESDLLPKGLKKVDKNLES